MIGKIGQKLTVGLGVALLTVAGCATYPDRVEELEQARSAVTQLEQQPRVTGTAASEMESARRYLREAQRAYEEQEPVELVEHKAYLARRHAEIGSALVANEALQREIDSAENARNQLLLESREARARQAEQEAAARLAQAEEAQREAQMSREETLQLQQQLEELQAEQTNRGMVLTLGDVLFDTNEAQLRSSADQTVKKLAEFMREYPDRELLVEGHTDSTGSAAYNEELSGRRADAVRDALVDQGVDPERIATEGLGEDYPVASNDSASGRQQNRRVEIVISDETGNFPEAAQRG